jgi:hypothetical protein
MTAQWIGEPVEWVGGANVPSNLGRSSASWPFAVLRLDEGGVRLRLRGLLGRLTGPLGPYTPVEIDVAFPCFRDMSQGIGLKTLSRADRAHLYFWTPAADEILRELKVRGFRTSDVPERAHVW